MTADAIYKEHRSNWSHQVSVMGKTQWLQRGQTLPLSVKGVACETMSLGEHHFTGSNPLSEFHSAHNPSHFLLWAAMATCVVISC